jgi:hypothetical protein
MTDKVRDLHGTGALKLKSTQHHRNRNLWKPKRKCRRPLPLLPWMCRITRSVSTLLQLLMGLSQRQFR